MKVNYKFMDIKIGNEFYKQMCFFQIEHNKNEQETKISFWENISIFFHQKRTSIKIKWAFVKNAFYRMFRGYDDCDVYNLYETFILKYEKILKHYKQNLSSFVYGLKENEWEEILDKMIYHLHWMLEENIDKELEKYVDLEDWYLSTECYAKIINKHKEEFFKLFSTYFFELWD